MLNEKKLFITIWVLIIIGWVGLFCEFFKLIDNIIFSLIIYSLFILSIVLGLFRFKILRGR